MTLPRRVLPGRTHLVTRRCAQRQFLLRPDEQINQVFLFCLGEAALRCGITLNGYVAMSNHTHLVLRDNRGNLPTFMGHFHKMMAKAVNAHWARWENLWSSRQPNTVHLVGEHDRFEKLVYVLANPAAADLVEHAGEWPGVSSLEQNLTGEPLVVARPRGYFREGGPMPERVELRVERPEGFEDMPLNDWRTMLGAAIGDAENAAREKRVAENRTVLGRVAILSTKPTDQPNEVEGRATIIPNVACLDVERRTGELLAMQRFRASHREAMQRWRAGERDIVFPEGTFGMRTLGAKCATDEPEGGRAIETKRTRDGNRV